MQTVAPDSQLEKVPNPDACWALLERVAASAPFKRTARLRELLLYIGRRSLKDNCEKIHESEIGSAVFERPANYDTSVDTIVRVNVTELRKRLEAFFNSEGRHEALIMEIPRGSYVPVFHYRPPERELTTEPPSTPQTLLSGARPDVPDTLRSSGRSRGLPAERIVTTLVILVLAAACAYFWSRYRNLHQSLYAWQSKPAVTAFWSQILSANANTDIVLADASFGLLQDIGKTSFTFDDYLSRSYISQIQAQHLSPEMHSAMNRIALWNLGSQDDFKLAERFLALDPAGKRIHLYDARDYMPDLITRDNVILIGGRISNPWDDLYEARMNFTVEFDDDGSISVVNRAPTHGEQQVYEATPSVGYCVVGYLPNPDQSGIVMLIEGTNAEATEGAGDFLLSNDELSNLKQMLHANKLPYFEVLLKVSSVPGTPLTTTIEAYRNHSNAPAPFPAHSASKTGP